MQNINDVDDPRNEEVTGHVMTDTDSGVIWRYTAIATIASLVLNLVLYLVGRSVNWIPESMPSSTETFSLTSVILMSVIPVVLFGALMAWLSGHAPRASRLFAIIVTVVLILAVMVPFTLDGIDDSFRLLLISMHIVTAGCCLVLTRTTAN